MNETNYITVSTDISSELEYHQVCDNIREIGQEHGMQPVFDSADTVLLGSGEVKVTMSGQDMTVTLYAGIYTHQHKDAWKHIAKYVKQIGTIIEQI